MGERKKRKDPKEETSRKNSLFVKKEQCSNNGTLNRDIKHSCFTEAMKKFSENQMPVSVCNRLEFGLQKEERSGAAF